jgi:hypothetical protein
LPFLEETETRTGPDISKIRKDRTGTSRNRSSAVFCGLATGLNRSLPKKKIKNILSR